MNSKHRYKCEIISRKYWQYFIPSIITAFALSLSEFVDSLVIANLLDAKAMAIVNVGAPLMMIISAIYLLIGYGGVIVYAENLGKKKEQKANEVFSFSILLALIIGLVVMFLGLKFLIPISFLLCPDLALGTEVVDYLKILIYSMPIIIVVMSAFSFLPAAGAPNLSVSLNVFANLMNLILDIVFIKKLHLTVVSAAGATLTAYLLSGIVFLFCVKITKLKLTKINWSAIYTLPEIFKKGIAVSLGQFGFTVKYAFSNSMAVILGGTVGIVTMSLCMQTISIISIILAGVVDTIKPFISILRAQQDYDSIKYLMRRNLILLFIASIIFTLSLELFPNILTSIYNVTNPNVIKIAIPAIRIFSLCFLFRTVCVFFMVYTSILGKTLYSSYISLFDGAIGIVVIGLLLTKFFGLDGIWITYPLDALLLFISILVINKIIIICNPEQYSDITLVEKDSNNIKVLDLAIKENSESISFVSQSVIDFLLRNKVPVSKATTTGLLAEEVAIYTRQHSSDKEILNLILKYDGQNIILDFRSVGKPFNMLATTDDDIEENVKLLQAFSSKIEYGYSLGMNNTRISISVEQ